MASRAKLPFICLKSRNISLELNWVAPTVTVWNQLHWSNISPSGQCGWLGKSIVVILVLVQLGQTRQGFVVVWSGLNFVSSPQSTRDIESRSLRSETRLKLFTLDPDTQVILCRSGWMWSAKVLLISIQPWDPTLLLCASIRNLTSRESSRTWSSLRRSLASACWWTATTWPSTCRAAWPRTRKDRRQT